MHKIIKLIAVMLAIVGGSFVPAYSDDAPHVIKPSDILPYLDRVIAWHKAIVNSDVQPDNGREAVIRDKLKINSKQTLDKSFEFARAETVIFGNDNDADITPEEANTRRGKILKASADVKAKIADIQNKLNTGSLTAGARENLNGQLKLAKAQQDLLKTMTSIFVTKEDKSGRLIDQVNSLAQTSSDDTTDLAATGKPSQAGDAEPQKEKPATSDDSGMFNLCSKLFSFAHKSSGIKDIRKQTADLITTNSAMVASIRNSLHDALAEGNALTSTADDAKSIADYHAKLDALLTHYKQLSAALVPLGEMIALLESEDRHLSEWCMLIDADWKLIFHQLLLRLVILSIGIAVPLCLSKLAFRSISRYVQDSRRQRQLRIGTRILLYVSLALVILANFLTEFGSLATFAGFITAGLAVALQTVLVSLVAHFFFYGRYGVRVGDRITVADVTGDIVQIGMLRIYVRQYAETDKGLMPTGKLVAFPNSILFQPTAFYKHMSEQEIKEVRSY